jgi:hypothetical protein
VPVRRRNPTIQFKFDRIACRNIIDIKAQRYNDRRFAEVKVLDGEVGDHVFGQQRADILDLGHNPVGMVRPGQVYQR